MVRKSGKKRQRGKKSPTSKAADPQRTPPPAGTQGKTPSMEWIAKVRRPERIQHLKKIEEERKSRVITYFMADHKSPFGTGMAGDAVPLFYEHLNLIGKIERIDILLYTRGGHTLTPNRLVHLIREYCSHLGVLVPFRAHSAGTSLALGADEIVMGPLGELGPVDPSVYNQFNPDMEADEKGKEKQKIPISVEDVTAFLALAEDRARLDTADARAQALLSITDKIHPLALGNVHRQHLLIRTMSKRLLSLHMDPEKESEKIDLIIDYLTEKLYYHSYEISRHEAKHVIGLKVTEPNETIDKLMWEAYNLYSRDSRLDGSPFSVGPFLVDAAFIESSGLTHSFILEGTATKGKDEINVNVQAGEWRKVE